MKEKIKRWAIYKIQGNVIDDGWYRYIIFNNGKPNLNAILILSEIIYWYRPTIVKDEMSGKIKGIKKKFKADMLQKSYDSLGQKFNLTKRQVKNACDQLVKMNLLDIEFRTINNSYGKQNMTVSNVMFVEPNLDNIIKISSMYQDDIKIIEEKKEVQEKVQEKEKNQEEKEIKKDLKMEFDKLPVESVKMTIYFIKKIKENFPRKVVPDFSKVNNNFLKWCQEMERINRIGMPGATVGKNGFSWEEIKKVIDWCQDNDFWKGNILSVVKLREKMITLQNQMNRNYNNKSKNKFNNYDQRTYNFEELERKSRENLVNKKYLEKEDINVEVDSKRNSSFE